MMVGLLRYGRVGCAIGLVMLIGSLISGALQAAVAQPLDRSTISDWSTTPVAVNYPNCRFGAGGDFATYPITPLNLGWVMDWGLRLNPSIANQAEYVQVVRLKPGSIPSIATVQAIADQNPGAVWLIGNEPDSPFQDDTLAADYAHAYYTWYTIIKQRDPTALLGAGNIVQPTPLRLQYLDLVLNAYRAEYGQTMPVDVWSIHSYVLRELDSQDPLALQDPGQAWGAFIPRDFLPMTTRGELYSLSDTVNPTIFRQRLIEFRMWLAARNYRNTPVYITEMGTLIPYPPYTDVFEDETGQPIVETRTVSFMASAFDFLLHQTDPKYGYPADDNRLVQRWLWYSFDDTRYGGPLFDPPTGNQRPLGDAVAAVTQALTPSLDLMAVDLVNEAVPVEVGDTATVTLHAILSNIGNISVSQPITIGFYAGVAPTGTLIGSASVTRSLAGCAAIAEVSLPWSDLTVGPHTFYVQVDATNAIAETNESNNLLTGVAFVAAHQLFLPQVRR